MPFTPSAQTYRVEYLCTANPRRPLWRDDEQEAHASLNAAIGRAMEIASRRGTAARVLDEVDAVVFQQGHARAA